jgi:hypothetical protein
MASHKQKVLRSFIICGADCNKVFPIILNRSALLNMTHNDLSQAGSAHLLLLLWYATCDLRCSDGVDVGRKTGKPLAVAAAAAAMAAAMAKQAAKQAATAVVRPPMAPPRHQ